MDKIWYQLEVVFTTPVLGTQPQKKTPASDYIRSQIPPEVGDVSDELETLDELMDKGTTGFYKLDGNPIFFDYQVKGFLKEAGKTFNGEIEGVKALRSKIDSLVFVEPRRIPLILPDGEVMTFNERPLRAETPQGPRTTLARSEQLPEGTKFSCRVGVYPTNSGKITFSLLKELLDYGNDKGYGAWRNAGWGRFEYTLTK